MSTVDDTVSYYVGLLAIQYRGQPNAAATIKARVTPYLMDLVMLDVQGGFDPSSSQGIQLDVLAKYVGVTRTGSGFNGEPITLDDTDFVQLITMAIVRNHLKGTLTQIQQLLNIYFSGQVFVYDHQNMTVSYIVSSLGISSPVVELFITEGLLPRNMGVQLASVIYVDNPTKLFGFCSYEMPNTTNSPLNTYENYQADYPMLAYEDALSV